MNVYRIVPALPALTAPVRCAVRIEAEHSIERDGALIPIFDALPGLRPPHPRRPILRKPGRHIPFGIEEPRCLSRRFSFWAAERMRSVGFSGCQKTQPKWRQPSYMRSADQYRKLSAELKVKAANEQDQSLASELDVLARSFLRLAEQAERNSSTDLWLEVGPKLRLDDDLPERD